MPPRAPMTRTSAPPGREAAATPPHQRETPTAYAARAHATGAGSAAGAASRSDGGTATGTETPHTEPAAPANRRTASGKPTQPDHAAAKVDAAADEEKPATTTAPANDRTDRRSRQRQAPAAKANPTSRRHQGAKSGRGPRGTTTARDEMREKESATTPPHTPARKTRRDPERRAPQRARNRMATSTARRRRRGQGRGGREDAPDRQARAG